MNQYKNIARTLADMWFPFFLIGVMILLAAPFSYGRTDIDSQDPWPEIRLGTFTGQQQDKLFTQADFYNYVRIRDEEYSECLKETWHDYSIGSGLQEEPRNTLLKQPVFNYSSQDITSPAMLHYSGVIGLNEMGVARIKSIPRLRKPEIIGNSSIRTSFLFYGQQINLRFDRLILLSTTASVSEDSISGFWKSFSRSNSNYLVDQLMDYRDLLGLGDWGYFQLVKAASLHILADNLWKSDQLTWALMIRSGFDVRLAFNQNSTTILFPSENTIYSRQYVIIGQKRFYLDREMKSQLLATYPNPYPDTDGMIDLRFARSLNFAGKLLVQKFIVTWINKKYEFSLRYNPEVIRFYAGYPKSDPDVYFGAPVSSTFKEDLLRQFYPVLSKINKAEAAALLQQFVQNDFVFSTVNKHDDLNSGRFPEEIIATKSGDARGKSVLYSWLVRILLRLPVVGVQFPGYYSTAVCYDEPLDGDSYLWRREKYIFTDPIYINAPIGVMIPEFAGLSPLLIDLPVDDSSKNSVQGIWKSAYKMGARRGGASQDVIFDKEGRAFITGYFPDKRLDYPFIACFSEGNSLQWIRKFEGDGRASAFAIARVNENEIYITGTFNGKITMDGNTIQSSSLKKELFIAQFNQNGELIWMKNIPIDSTPKDDSLAFLIKSDRTGDNISIHWFNEDGRNVKTGFGGISETGIYFSGAINFSSSKRSAKPELDLAKELEAMARLKYDPKVTPILTVLKWLYKPGNEITGPQIQTLINLSNPLFAIDHPTLFKTLGQIALLKNSNGVVTLSTNDYKSILLNNLRVENGAEFTISPFGNGDLSVNCVSGFRNIINQLILSVNSLLFDCSAGNVILDYDYDHTLKTVSLNF